MNVDEIRVVYRAKIHSSYVWNIATIIFKLIEIAKIFKDNVK